MCLSEEKENSERYKAWNELQWRRWMHKCFWDDSYYTRANEWIMFAASAAVFVGRARAC